MAEHFKLEITNRSTKITTWTGVSPNFADEYRANFSGFDNVDTDVIDNKPMSDALKTVFSVVNDFVPKEPSDSAKRTAKKNAGKYAKFNYAKRVKQRASQFKTYAYINFVIPNVQFVTLTFDSRIFNDANDLKACHIAFRNFIKRIRHQFDDFRYLAVFSRQRNGNWHYHMICNFDETVSGKIIRELWRNGIVHNTVITKYDEFDTKISYCVDNMTKIAWEDLQGEQGYLHSDRLQNKIVLRSWNDDEYEMAMKFLREILGSTDLPVPISSTEISEPLSAYEIKRLSESYPNGKISSNKSFNINYLISHKGFAELFDKPVVAKKK